MRDHFASFWSKVASSFKNKNILGYEIINEPWVGNWFKQPSLLLPGVAGSTNLQPFYDVISNAIRKEDPNHLIFYEPVTWGMIFNGTVSGSGFTHVPGGSEYADKSVFSFHYYCWWWTEDNNLTRQTCDRMFGEKVFDQVQEDIRILGGAAMMTEWGLGCDPTYGITDECDPIMDLADSHLMSWTDWWWTGPLMNGWHATPESIAIYSRTFAQSIAGTPTVMKYNSKTLDFKLCYDIDTNIIQPTEIFYNNEVHYTNGINVRLNGSGASSIDVNIDINRIYLTYNPNKIEKIQSDTLNVCAYITSK